MPMVTIELRLQKIIDDNRMGPVGCSGTFAYLGSAKNEKRLAAAKLLGARRDSYWNRVNGRNHVSAMACKLAEVAGHRRAAALPPVEIITLDTVHVVAERRIAA